MQPIIIIIPDAALLLIIALLLAGYAVLGWRAAKGGRRKAEGGTVPERHGLREV